MSPVGAGDGGGGGAASGGSAAPPRPKRIAVAPDVTPDLQFASVVIAGVIPDGRILVERGVARGRTGDLLEDHRAGTDWVIPRILELKSRHRIAAVVIDPMSPASILIPEAEKSGLDLTLTSTRDVAQAFGLFLEWVVQGKLVHLGHQNEDLRRAVAGAARREIGDGQFAWSRKSTTVDISPLCAATLAAWAAHKFGRGYDVLKSVA
jgi:hypothetical protein